MTRKELKGIVQGLETQSVHVSNCSFEMLRWIEDAPKAVASLLSEVEQLQRDLEFERQTNNFDTARLRRLATLVGRSTPESDETLLACAGTVIGGIALSVERMFKDHNIALEGLHSLMVERDRYKAALERIASDPEWQTHYLVRIAAQAVRP